jgi:hypothetical protein
MIGFLLPFGYVTHSRLRKTFERISWPLLYHVPLLVLCWHCARGPRVPFVLSCALVLSLYYTVYELGHIQNDVFTVKRELAPTLRLPEGERALLERRFPAVVAGRLGIAALLFLALHGLGRTGLELHLPLLAAGLAATLVVFHAHNTIRGRANGLTFLLLMILKYATPVLVYTGAGARGLEAVLLVTLLFPVCRTFEYVTRHFGRAAFRGRPVDYDAFRVAYYLGLSLLALAWHLLPGQRAAHPTGVFLGLALYYLAYRTASLLALVLRPGLRAS